MLVRWLLKYVPPHREYLELFGGGAALLFAKEPSEVETYNDIDSGLVGFFRVLRDPEKFRRLQFLASLTPHSREEYYHCLRHWTEGRDDVERAYMWWCAARQSFAGRFDAGWGSTVTSSTGGLPSSVHSYLSAISDLPEFHRRVVRVQIENLDWRVALERYVVGSSTLVYADPPYVHGSRRDKDFYGFEMSDDDHRELIDALMGTEAMVMLSGYDNEIYAPLVQNGWRRFEKEVTCFVDGVTRASGLWGNSEALRRRKRVEVLWLNPAAVDALDRQRLPLLALVEV